MMSLARNPLYVLELDRRCTAIEVERAAKRVLSMLSLGFDGADRYDTPFGPRPRDVELVRWAAAELRDPERRARHAATAIRAEAPPEDRVRRGPGRPAVPIPRETLLAAACRVFDRDGYGAARLTDVAREAGISKGALAYHFPTKDALYLELIAGIASAFYRLVSEALTAGGRWEERLDALGEASVAVLGHRPELARLMLRELTDGGPYVAGPGGLVVDALVGAIVGFLDEGVACGCVAPQDTRHLAGTIVALHVGWFGAPALSGRLGGRDADALAVRGREVRRQVRRLCSAGDLTARTPKP